MAVLRVIEGHAPFEVTLPENAVIGRSSSVDIRLADLTVSRRHASIQHLAGAYVLTDLGSGNGCFVNDARIEGSAVLSNGDRVRIGDVALEIEIPEEESLASSDSGLELSEEGGSKDNVLDRLNASAHLSVAGSDEKAAERLKLLYDISREIGHSFEENAILQTVIDRLFEVFPQADSAAAVLYDAEHDLLVPKRSRSRRSDGGELRISRSLIREVMDSRSAMMTADAAGDRRFQEFKTVHDLDLRAVLCVPMISGEDVYGVLQLAGADSRLPFDREDMVLLLGIAGQTALALSNATLHRRLLQQQLLEKDLTLATKIQQGFLPREPPAHERWVFEPRYTPALQVGGDYYGFLESEPGFAGVAIGDVSGKGVSAALYMARLSSEIRYQAVGESRPGEILEKLNDVLAAEAHDGMFVTLILCMLEISLRRMYVANAGHHSPLVCSKGGQLVHLDVPQNVPLGVVADSEFEEATFELDPGDTVVLYTDGVNEAENASGEQFGDDRLAQAIQESDHTPSGVAENVYGRVRGFVGETTQSDDITLVVFGPLAT